MTTFERDALAALEPLTGALTLTRKSGRLPFLTGPIPGTDLVLYLYGVEAQVAGPHVSFRKEEWDYDTPADSIKDLVAFVSANLP